MNSVKLFTINSLLFLLSYLLMNFLGFVAFAIFEYTTRVPNIFIYTPRSAPLWVEIILWSHVLISIILYFLLGTKLFLLKNPLLNYLSICLYLLLALLLVYSSPYIMILTGFSFLKIGADIFNNSNIANISVTILPSIIIWLGIFYQSKKKQNSSIKLWYKVRLFLNYWMKKTTWSNVRIWQPRQPHPNDINRHRQLHKPRSIHNKRLQRSNPLR